MSCAYNDSIGESTVAHKSKTQHTYHKTQIIAIFIRIDLFPEIDEFCFVINSFQIDFNLFTSPEQESRFFSYPRYLDK